VSILQAIMPSLEWPEIEWPEIAIILTEDDSDGSHARVVGPPVTLSNVTDDRLLAAGRCVQPTLTDPSGGAPNVRSEFGPRLPLRVLAPWAKTNDVDHRVTDPQSSLTFIEDTWDLPRIGNGSAVADARTLNGMFDFDDGPDAGRDPSSVAAPRPAQCSTVRSYAGRRLRRTTDPPGPWFSMVPSATRHTTRRYDDREALHPPAPRPRHAATSGRAGPAHAHARGP